MLEKVVIEENITARFSLTQTTTGLLVYPDNIAIIGDSIGEVKSTGQKFIKTAGKFGL